MPLPSSTDSRSLLSGKRILITGSTGFTGSWTSKWLLALGAEIQGYSLPPKNELNLFTQLNLNTQFENVYSDIRDKNALNKVFKSFDPDLVLHLAAQPLVKQSYLDPIETFETNVLGTANVLESAIRHHTKGVLCITTDKVYKDGGNQAFIETDPLGGNDPYSASKSAAEMIINSYSKSYGRPLYGTSIASARGGNIIGGGDWSEDRIVPDFVRSIHTHQELMIRYPYAIRPWQHVLALIQGYILLLEKLSVEDSKIDLGSWNFGPDDSSHCTVKELIEKMAENWEMPVVKFEEPSYKETHQLRLNNAKSKDLLNWKPIWNLDRTIRETITWYKTFSHNPKSIIDLTDKQIKTWQKEYPVG